MARWNARFPIKDLFPEDGVEDEEAQRIGKTVATRLRERPGVFGPARTQRFAQRFDKVGNQDQFNKVLNDLYDIADNIHVWIE